MKNIQYISHDIAFDNQIHTHRFCPFGLISVSETSPLNNSLKTTVVI